MATRYAVADGLFTSTSTWATGPGGTPGASVPGSGDTAELDDRSIYLTGANISTLRISNSGVTNSYLYGATGVGSGSAITIDGTVSIGSGGYIDLVTGSSLSVASGGQLRVESTLDMPGSTLAVSAIGYFTVAGFCSIQGGSSVTINSGVSVYGTFVTAGTYVIDCAIDVEVGGSFSLDNGSNFNGSNSTTVTVLGSLRLNERGSMNVTGSSFTFEGAWDVQCYCDIDSGAIAVAEGVTSISGNATLTLAGALTVMAKSLLMLMNGFEIVQNEQTIGFGVDSLLFIDDAGSSLVIDGSASFGETTIGAGTLLNGAYINGEVPPDPDAVLTTAGGNYDVTNITPANVRNAKDYGVLNTSMGELMLPDEADVLDGVKYGYEEEFRGSAVAGGGGVMLVIG